jgi:O-antigen ligase
MRAVRGELTVLYGFAAVIMGVATFASLSRGGMISLIAGLMFVVAFGVKSSDQYDSGRSSRLPFRLPRVLMKSGSLVAIVVTIGVGVWWVGADPVIRRVEKGELSLAARPDDPRKETFFNSRGFIWSDTVSLIRDNWVTGVGFGAFQTAYPIYNRRDGTLLVSQAHNDYLQILADCGILGAIIALWFIYIVFRSTRQALLHRDPAMSGLALGCAGGLFAMLVHSLFDFNLQLPSNALLFLVLTSVVSQVADAAVEGRVRQSVPDRAVRLSVAA